MNTTAIARWPSRAPPLLLGTLPLLCGALAYSLVQWPALATGVLFGLVILGTVLIEPLALVGLMLAIGPLDLSFMTGGFKALFPQAGGLDMNGIRLIGVTFGFSALVLAEPAVLRQITGKGGRWYLLFLIWAAASLATTWSTVEGLRLLLKIAYPLLTFAVVAGLVKTPQQLEKLLLVTVLTGALVVVAVNPLFVVGGGYRIDEQGFRRVSGLGIHENPFSFYLFVLMMIAFARFVARGKVLFLALCALIGFWIVMTHTRITVLACFAGIGVMVVYAALERRNYRAVIAGLLFGTLLASALLPAAFRRTIGYVPTIPQFVSLARSPTALYEAITQAGGWQGREVLWPIVYNAFRADPVTGLGMGSSTIVVRQNFPSSAAEVVHNEYLRLATDTGLIGSVLFFLAMLSWVLVTIRSSWRGTLLTREFAMPALGVIAGWVFIALTDNAFDYYASFTQYAGFLVGGTVAAARLSRPASAQSSQAAA